MGNEVVVSQNALTALIEKSGLSQDQKNLMTIKFGEAFDIAKQWEEKAATIEVTDASQTDLMQQARDGRLFLSKKRIAVEKTRKEMKESSLREGQAIDLIARTLTGLIKPIEDHLEQQERFVELREAEEAIERAKKAEALLKEQEAAAEKIRHEKEKEERERIQKENEELRAAKAKSDAEAAETRRVAAEKQREADEQVRQERLKTKAAEDARLKAEANQRTANARILTIQTNKNKEIAQVRSENKALNTLVKRLIQCPECGHKFELPTA